MIKHHNGFIKQSSHCFIFFELISVELPIIMTRVYLNWKVNPDYKSISVFTTQFNEPHSLVGFQLFSRLYHWKILEMNGRNSKHYVPDQNVTLTLSQRFE